MSLSAVLEFYSIYNNLVKLAVQFKQLKMPGGA